MSHLQLDFVVKSVNGKILSHHQKTFEGIATDTRKSMPNQLFIALKGDAFDAHQFLQKAVDQNAAGLLIHDDSQVTEAMRSKLTIIHVKDTLQALQDLAQAYRLKNKAVIIGVAGSNGKTTSKEFCAAVLGAACKVHYSKGSFNNHWGVPFTLLAQPENAEVAVVEMGMNHAGELQRLAEIAAVDIAVCTYVGVEHIEHFGTLEKIADAEEEIYLYSPAQATRIFNLDNAYTRKMLERSRKKFPQSKMMTFSESAGEKADVQFRLKEVSMESLSIEGQIQGVSGEATVPVFGKHNLTNLMVAASAALAYGLKPEQIWKLLPLCRTTWGRNQLVTTQSGAQILFDGYNSNPDSMKALVDNMSLVKAKGRKIGIFAEMRELGDLAAQLHEETGRAVGNSRLDSIWFYGAHAEDFVRGLKAAKFAGEIISNKDFDEATANKLAASLKSGDIALVKGSRGMQLERFVLAAKPLNFEAK
jgi:UDP-N-acetylmuramoyl-tripeptide--D-alanyl-D-alanine ligase